MNVLAAEALLIAEYRAKYPEGRARSIIVRGINTAVRANERCIVCGKEGPVWSAQWPKTKKAKEWAIQHRKEEIEKCIAKWAAFENGA